MGSTSPLLLQVLLDGFWSATDEFEALAARLNGGGDLGGWVVRLVGGVVELSADVVVTGWSFWLSSWSLSSTVTTSLVTQNSRAKAGSVR